MFIQTSRYSLNGSGAEQAAHSIYNKAQALWQKAGAHSMDRYVVFEGEKAGQHMVVVRFSSAEAWHSGRGSIEDERAELMKEMDAAGIKLEEILLLNEVAPATAAQAAA